MGRRKKQMGGKKEEANGGGEKMQGEQNLGDQATMERGNPSLSGRTAPSSVASSFPNHKASASDIVALLGTRQQASQISAKEARQLRSCFKFLVPFTPNSIGSASGDWSICRRLWSKEGDGQCRREENELVWWPPIIVSFHFQFRSSESHIFNFSFLNVIIRIDLSYPVLIVTIRLNSGFLRFSILILT